MEATATHAGQPASKKRLNWSKVHLIYFALASFDVLAIIAGLWLADFTKGKFEDAVHSFQLGDLLRDNTSAVIEAVIALSGPTNDIFETGDAAKARQDLQVASDAFDMALASDHYDADTKEVMDAAVAAAGGSKSAYRRGGLALWYPQIYAKFESAESRIRKLKHEQVTETLKAIEAFEKGDQSAATVHMGRSDLITRTLLRKTLELLENAAQVSDTTIARSRSAFDLAGMLQYAIGGAILLLVLLVIGYGHFVGRLLHRKYNQLEASNAELEAFSGKLQQMNGDITNLNVELAGSMKKLTEAQSEIVRKGRLAQLGQLTATVAHELRNPLSAVRTSAFIVERRLKAEGVAVAPQFERINNGIQRCDNIISQLLDFARSSAPVFSAWDADAWLAKILEEEAEKLPAAVAIEFEPGLDGLTVYFDENRMRRVFVNLLSNASEAMVGKGDNPAKFSVSEPKIVVATKVTSRGVEIVVSDNGPGMAPEVLEKIRDPLFTTKTFGTGLGLPAVEKILHEHGGDLVVQSTPGQGAKFTAWFPTQLAANAA